ncbi:MAG: hypothetical protein ACLPUT_05250 [Solirubrobacteraceae bacterium]|jgi:hypothetical protein
MSWSGFKRGWRELRQSELSWQVFKRGQRELRHPPRKELTPEARKRMERSGELGFPAFLLSYQRPERPKPPVPDRDASDADE